MIKKERVPSSLKMISYDVSSFPYGDKEIETKISRKDIRNLLSICPKNVYFTFGNNIYLQKDGVAMEYSLGPAFAGIFMVHLETTLMPELEKFMKS